MPVTAAVAAANTVNAANGPFPAYMSSAGGPNGPAPGPPPGPGSNSTGKQDGSSVDGAVVTAEPDMPMNNLGSASVASEPLGGADRIDYGGAQLLEVPGDDHEAHTHSHVSHHGEDDDEPHDEPQSKRNLALWSAALALGGTSIAAAITAIAVRPRMPAK